MSGKMIETGKDEAEEKNKISIGYEAAASELNRAQPRARRTRRLMGNGECSVTEPQFQVIHLRPLSSSHVTKFED